MLNFILSTAAFSLAVYGLNSYFDAQSFNCTRSGAIITMVAATNISISTGWIVDQLDGDAELHKNDLSIAEMVQNGDPVMIAKLLAGFN